MDIQRYQHELGTSNIHAGTRSSDDRVGPLVSIVTICRNAGDALRVSLDCVKEQTYENIEYVIVDGASKDGTVDFILANQSHITTWVSEADLGIADAFNKGIALARGRYIKLLNADDRLPRDYVERAVQEFQNHSEATVLYGNVLMCDQNSVVTRRFCGRLEALSQPLSSMATVPHCSMIVDRKAYQQVGLFDVEYHLAMDYDWFLRFKRSGLRARYTAKLYAYMREGGVSNRQRNARDFENLKIAEKHKEIACLRARFIYAMRHVVNLLENEQNAAVPVWAARGIGRIKNRLLRRGR